MPGVTVPSSRGSRTGLSSWVTWASLSPAALVFSLQSRVVGRSWRFKDSVPTPSPRTPCIPSPGGARTAGGPLDRCANGGLRHTTFLKGIPGRASRLTPSNVPSCKPRVQMGGFGQDWDKLIFREMSFEMEEPKRISWTAGGRKRTLSGPVPEPLAGDRRSCLAHIEGGRRVYSLTWHQSPSCVFLNMAKASSSTPSGSRSLIWREAAGVALRSIEVPGCQFYEMLPVLGGAACLGGAAVSLSGGRCCLPCGVLSTSLEMP